MDLSPRQNEIMSEIRAKGAVKVEPLATRFQVTTQTIRRDLGELCDYGLAARTHGGAKALMSVANNSYQDRRATQRDAKQAIARSVAALIPEHCSIMLNIGTTTETIASALTGHAGLVVVSNNINVINTFIGSKAKELLLAGGIVRPSDGAIVGEDAVEFIGRYKADYAIIGASALDEDGAVLDFDAREVSVARAILRNARTKILAADTSKFAHSAPVRICDIDAIDMFVTNSPPPPAFERLASAAQTKLVISDD